MAAKKSLGVTARAEQVAKECLLYMAKRQGPVIDQIDCVGDGGELTRDVIEALVKANVGSPAELRVAMEDLISVGSIAYLGPSELYSRDSRVGLTARGLVKARRVKRGIGTPAPLRLTLKAKFDRLFDARFQTDHQERDRKLNKSGVALSLFYLLAIEKPAKESPVGLDWFVDRMPMLAVIASGPRSGRGDRLETSANTISDTLDLLGGSFRGVLPLVRTFDERDKRRVLWYLDGPFPGVEMVVPPSRRELRSWSDFFLKLSQAYGDEYRKRGLKRAR